MGATVMRRSSMFAPATPLVPEDQDHEREFIPCDLDQERKQRRQLERVNRSVAIRRPPIVKRMAKSLARFCALCSRPAITNLDAIREGAQPGLNPGLSPGRGDLSSLLPVRY